MSELKNWTIYKITSPTNRIYIGITSQWSNRMSAYRNCDKRLEKQTLIYNSIRKYGYESHTIKQVDNFVSDLSYANGKEMWWVRTFMSNKNRYPKYDGINLNVGGGGSRGYKASKEKIDAHRKKMIGKKASEETKKRMSLSQKGTKKNCTHYTPEFRKKLSDRSKLYKHTDEAKKKISEASKGNKYRLGTKMTKEQIEHRSSMIRGRKITGAALDAHISRVIMACAKPVLQYDLNGIFIAEYPMIKTAAQEIGIPRLGILRNLSGQYKQSRGFIFKYK